MNTALALIDKWGNDVTQERSRTTTTSDRPADWLLEIMGGGQTAAGITITRDLALTVDTLFKGVALVCTDMAKGNLNLYQVKDGVKRLATEHPAYWMMRHKPNPYQRAFDYKQQLTMHKILYGASFALNIFNGRGQVVASLPLMPDCVSVENTARGLIYHISMFRDDGSSIVYTADSSQVRHETWLSYDGMNGYGVIKTAKELLARIIAMRNYGTTVFKNAGRPATVIKLAQELRDEAARDKFIASWQRMYAGTENAHKTALLPVGAEIQTLASTARDAQFSEQEERSIKQVANHLLMPASKLNGTAAAGYKSLEQDDLQYQNDCLHGHQVSFEECCNSNFLTEEEIKDGYFFEFEQNRYRTADLASLGEFLSKALGNNAAWMTPNQVRTIFGDNAVPGGDELPRVETQAPAAAPEPKDTPEDDTEDDTEMIDSLRAVAHDALRRAVTRLTEQAKRGYKDGGEAGALGAVDCRECIRVAEIIGPATRAYMAGTKQKTDYRALLTMEMVSIVGEAAKQGPDGFARAIVELSTGIPERLIA